MPVELFVDHAFLFRLVNVASVIFVGCHCEPTPVPGEDDACDTNEDPLFNDNPQPDDNVRPHKPSHCEL